MNTVRLGNPADGPRKSTVGVFDAMEDEDVKKCLKALDYVASTVKSIARVRFDPLDSCSSKDMNVIGIGRFTARSEDIAKDVEDKTRACNASVEALKSVLSKYGIPLSFGLSQLHDELSRVLASRSENPDIESERAKAVAEYMDLKAIYDIVRSAIRDSIKECDGNKCDSRNDESRNARGDKCRPCRHNSECQEFGFPPFTSLFPFDDDFENVLRLVKSSRLL